MELPVDPGGVQVEEGLLELLIVQDAPEDGLVLVHAGHDGGEEALIEDEPEVLQGVRPRLRGHLQVRQPGALELVEEQLVPLGEGQAELLVELVDDL